MTQVIKAQYGFTYFHKHRLQTNILQRQFINIPMHEA